MLMMARMTRCPFRNEDDFVDVEDWEKYGYEGVLSVVIVVVVVVVLLLLRPFLGFGFSLHS